MTMYVYMAFYSILYVCMYIIMSPFSQVQWRRKWPQAALEADEGPQCAVSPWWRWTHATEWGTNYSIGLLSNEQVSAYSRPPRWSYTLCTLSCNFLNTTARCTATFLYLRACTCRHWEEHHWSPPSVCLCPSESDERCSGACHSWICRCSNSRQCSSSATSEVCSLLWAFQCLCGCSVG